ncbi:DNA-binding protein [Neorhizobium sp. NPDC001467]|uniref:helix-turn-helix domain-containing transcriptional regulator n=1 Tax=Neorhizobium sp. NPDC001467 TaxID=3390595 RepID=UPI003CFC76BA
MIATSRFEIADYLDSPEDMLEYLEMAMEDENPDVFIATLGHAAKAWQKWEKKNRPQPRTDRDPIR